MSSIDHLHVEDIILKVTEHSELLSTQYLARCLEPYNVDNSTPQGTPLKRMKHTQFTRHRASVEPMMLIYYMKATLQTIHTETDDNVESLAHTRAKSRMMLDSTSASTAAKHPMTLIISSFVLLIRRHWYRQIYRPDQRTPSGNSSISRQETQDYDEPRLKCEQQQGIFLI